MENVKKSYYTIFPALLMIFVALIPLMSILSDVVKLTSLLFFIIKILYVVILFLLLIVNVVLLFLLMKEIVKCNDISKGKKTILLILLVLFSLIVMPYIYHKYILKDIVKPNSLIIYFIAIVFLAFVFAFGYRVYNKKINEEIQKQKELEAKRVTYIEKNNQFSFDFKTSYKQKEVGEYDLYVKDKKRNIVFTTFTYDTSRYEQKTIEEYLLKGVADIEATKENAKIYKEKKLTELEDKKVYEIVYEGKVEKSDPCIYRISVIQFNSNPELIEYVVTVSLKEDYPSLEKEINEIINSVKIIQNE
ncbi:MAG: hypothetical protein IKE10_02240 [Bacilli bacterium]|nr:hypothetical protein [Bacilli bacterium]